MFFFLDEGCVIILHVQKPTGYDPIVAGSTRLEAFTYPMQINRQLLAYP